MQSLACDRIKFSHNFFPMRLLFLVTMLAVLCGCGTKTPLSLTPAPLPNTAPQTAQPVSGNDTPANKK